MRMMRVVVVVALCFGGAALADVFPGNLFKPVCNVPEGCVQCSLNDDACIAGAEDAGLQLSPCSDGRGVPQKYICPPGHLATQRCGCSAGEGLAALSGLLALRLFTTRRRR